MTEQMPNNDAYQDETVQMTPAVPAPMPEDPVVEGPSATSSAAQNSSGPAAYIVFAVALVALLGLGTAAIGAFGAFVSMAIDGISGVEYQVETLPNGEGLSITIPPTSDSIDGLGPDDELWGLDDELWGLDDNSGANLWDEDNLAGLGVPYTTEEALGLSYLFENGGLEAALVIPEPKNDGQKAVAQFAQDLADIDARYNEQAVKLLDEMRANPEKAADQLAAFQKLCDEAEAEIDKLAVPTEFGSSGATQVETITQMLESAKGDAQDRWFAINSLMEMIVDPADCDIAMLEFFDEYVEYYSECTAEDIALAFESAA